MAIGAIVDLLSDAKLLQPLLAKAGVAPIDEHAVIDAAAARARDLTANAAGDDRTTIRNMIAHVIVAEASLSIGLAIPHLLQVLDAAPVASQVPLSAATIHEIVLPVRLKRTGLEMRLVDERTSAQAPDPALIRLLSRAWAIRSEVLQGDGRSLDAIATSHGIGSSYLSRLLRLGFLGRDIVETILNGKQPPDLTANRLATLPTIPTDWNEQKQVILGTPDR